jgi:hypothetical protein
MTLFATTALIVSLITMIWSLRQHHKAKKQQKINALLSATLHDLYTAAESEVRKNKKLIERAENLTNDAKSSMGLGLGHPDNIMDDPGMLATLVTAIIHKYGDVKLGMRDFTSLGDDDFVSVYVDTISQDLILSLKKDLASEDVTSFTTFGSPDDGTYH